jgi:hypothetical protein
MKVGEWYHFMTSEYYLQLAHVRKITRKNVYYSILGVDKRAGVVSYENNYVSEGVASWAASYSLATDNQLRSVFRWLFKSKGIEWDKP